MKEWCVQRRYSILFMLLMFCIAFHVISKSYGFFFPADEFGYWSYAARLAGYDWSDIASLGSYYSYGYSLILLPVFLIFKNGVIAYRVALLANFILLAVCFFVLQKMEEDISPVNSAAAVFYPTWLFYAGTTFAEILIVTLYVVLCFLLLKYIKTDNKIFAAASVGIMIYMYFVHMRALGVLISGIFALLVYGLKTRKTKIYHIFICAAGMAVLLAAGILIKRYWTGTVYGDASNGLKNANDYAGQLEKIAYIFKGSGFKKFMISLSGKLLYLGIAGYGISYVGIGYCISRLIDKKTDRNKIFYLFVLVSTVAAIMISTVYTVHLERVDTFAYGRYHEYVMPILMLTGIKALSEKTLSAKKVILIVLVIVLTEAVMLWQVITGLREGGQTGFFGNTICGMSWLYDPENFEPILFYCKAYIAGIVLTIFFCIGIWWTSRKKVKEIFLMFIVAVQVMIGIRLSSMYIDSSRLGCFRDTLVVQKIHELNSQKDREVYYSTEGESYGNIGILQFMMRDTKINIIKDNFDLNSQGREDLLLMDYRSNQTEMLKEAYDSQMTFGHFTLMYNK